MHEYSIVQALLGQCEEQAKVNNAKKITKVTVKIGILSGVETDLLKSAFETFKEGTVCDHAQFIANLQPIIVKCLDCEKENILEKYEYICPNCKSQNLQVIDGEDMYLMSLEME